MFLQFPVYKSDHNLFLAFQWLSDWPFRTSSTCMISINLTSLRPTQLLSTKIWFGRCLRVGK
jgi:hypothetical protein